MNKVNQGIGVNQGRVNQAKVKEEVERKISKNLYYPRGDKLRYIQDTRGEMILGLEAIALLTYDMGKGAINMSGSVLSKFKNLYSRTFKNSGTKSNGIKNPITNNRTKNNGTKIIPKNNGTKIIPKNNGTKNKPNK